MKKPKVYYRGEVVFDNLSQAQLDELERRKIVKKEQEELYILLENAQFKHLFNPKIPFYKKKQYFRQLNKTKLFCEDCGKPYSFHIRPVIEADDTVNFKKIVCVCKECRFKTLQTKDIVVPQFKKDFSEESILQQIKNETYDAYDISFAQKLLSNTSYITAYKEEKKLYSLTKIPLPPLTGETALQRRIREDMERIIVSHLGSQIKLDNEQHRIEVKKYLLGECYGVCPCCGEYMNQETITIDHIIAKSNGGDNSIYNFIGLCETCNKDKDADSIIEFLRRKVFQTLPVRVLRKAYAEQEVLKGKLSQVRDQIEQLVQQEKEQLA